MNTQITGHQIADHAHSFFSQDFPTDVQKIAIDQNSIEDLYRLCCVNSVLFSHFNNPIFWINRRIYKLEPNDRNLSQDGMTILQHYKRWHEIVKINKIQDRAPLKLFCLSHRIAARHAIGMALSKIQFGINSIHRASGLNDKKACAASLRKYLTNENIINYDCYAPSVRILTATENAASIEELTQKLQDLTLQDLNQTNTSESVKNISLNELRDMFLDIEQRINTPSQSTLKEFYNRNNFLKTDPVHLKTVFAQKVLLDLYVFVHSQIMISILHGTEDVEESLQELEEIKEGTGYSISDTENQINARSEAGSSPFTITIDEKFLTLFPLLVFLAKAEIKNDILFIKKLLQIQAGVFLMLDAYSKELILADRACALELVKKNGCLLAFMNSELQKDRDFILAAIACHYAAAAKNIDDPRLAREAVAINETCAPYLPAYLQGINLKINPGPVIEEIN